MSDSQVVYIKDIGKVLLEHGRRARRVTISIRPRKDIKVRVGVPRNTSFKAAMDFVRVKEKWIKKHLERIREFDRQKQKINEAFQSIDKAEARKRITGRLKELAERYGFSYCRISIRNQRTRWGSCSSKGSINLNIKLVMLPPDLLDYVIFHELVHTRAHNHSKQFWNELDKYVGNGKEKAKRLVEYGMGLL